MITKGKIAARALDSIGIGGNYESDMIVRAVDNLDEMMLSWEQDGVIIGYIHTDETANPTDDSGIPDYSRQAVILNLACQMAMVLRMPVDQSMLSRASVAYKNLIPIEPPSMAANPYMPLGAGNNAYYNTPAFQSRGETALTNNQDTPLLADIGDTE